MKKREFFLVLVYAIIATPQNRRKATERLLCRTQ